MRIPINLASEPFRRDRPQLLAYGVCAMALVALLGVLIFLIFSERDRLRETRASVDTLNTELQKISSQQAQLDATLRQPANAEVLERSVLLNALIERKSISWVKIFSDLEGVLPNNVKIIQVRLPQITARNEVTLDMEVGAQDPAQVIEFLKRLEASPVFGQTSNPRSTPPTQNEPLYRYQVTVNYAQKLD
jgi:type IV pilus assembly protein PilN